MIKKTLKQHTLFYSSPKQIPNLYAKFFGLTYKKIQLTVPAFTDVIISKQDHT